VALVASVSGSVANGASTQNLTISALVAEGAWSTFDPETGNGEFGGVQVAREGGVTTATLNRSVGEIVLCEGGGTTDPSDDFYGFKGTEITGSGPATLTVGRQYRSARATGTVTAEVVSYDECTGDFGTTTTKTIRFSMTLTGVGPVMHESSRSTLRIPSQVTAQQQIRGTLRQAAGSVKLGAVLFDADAVIGQLTLRLHETVH
jgi:hypothetical protein